MKTRIAPLLMALVLCVGVFAGCQSSELRPYSDAEESGAVDTENLVKDYTPVFESYEPDTVMLTINGHDVTWREIFYWFYYDISSIEYYYGEITDWNAVTPFDETATYSEFLKKDALDVSKYYRAIESKYDELGLALSDEELSVIDENWLASVDSYGGEEEYLEYLKSMFMSKELYYYFEKITSMFYALQEEVCGANGEKLDVEDVLGLAEEKGYMRAKHIVLKTTNDANEPLSEEEIAEKLATAESLLTQLQEIEDPDALEAKMDELMNEFSEDTGLASYPDGYTFLSGEMVEEFENAVAEMDPYGLSGIVESTYGYHIILRLPLITTAAVEYTSETEFSSLGYLMAQEIFTSILDGWVEEVEVVFSKEFEEINVEELFSKAVMVPAPAEESPVS